MQNRKKKILLVSLLCLVMVLVACGKREEKQGQTKAISIYYLNREDTKLIPEEYVPKSEEVVEKVKDLLKMLRIQPDSLECKATIPDTLKVLECKINENQITVNFTETYLKMEAAKEILTRAAIVRTLTQLPEIEYVTFQINGNPLLDSRGEIIGTMTADLFIDNAGKEINTYEKAKLKLYFANAAGDKLIVVNRTKAYNSNISLDKLVVEELIAGPTNEESYPTINPTTKVISVTTKDGTCYVNLSEEFLTPTTKTSADVTIYSITNSLAELPNVNKVQILINGETTYTFRDKFPLSTVFEHNLELVE